jgi:hypothetical protein
MKRTTLYLALTALVLSSRLWAQVAAPPIAHVGVSPDARKFLDSLAVEARTKRIENAGCLTAYAIVGDTLYLDRVSPATYTHADSMSIFSTTLICNPGVPTIHSHRIGIVLAPPSQTDIDTAHRFGTWALILVVFDADWQLLVYPRQ